MAVLFPSRMPQPVLAMAGVGHRPALLSRKRTTAVGRGCVKTPALRLHVENLSQLRQSEEQRHWRLLLGKDNRENYAARYSFVHVFTQPRPIAVIEGGIRCGYHGRTQTLGGRP